MRTALIIIMAAISAGCGSALQVGRTNKATNGAAAAGPASADAKAESPAMTVADDASLPACDAAHDGWLVYVNATKSFRTCAGGQWTVISLQGQAGPAGPPGAAAASIPGAGTGDDYQAGYSLYQDYRKSVFRITTVCIPVTPTPAACTANAPNPSLFLGSAFLCDANTLCTNIHVATCEPSGCYTFKSLSVQATKGDTDTLNPDASGVVAPFFSVTSTATFKLHPTFDVAKIPVTGLPAAAKVMPLTSQAAAATVQDLLPVLSMSFPLGFQDLYTDVGRVNTPFIGECDTQGGLSGYGCPKAAYAFSTTNETDHGSSGSPLVDVNTGLVIGITAAGTDGANANYTWAVDAVHIAEIK